MSQSPAPNDPSKGLPPWLLFAFLVVGPPAGIIALARTITQNPVVIAVLVVLYEVLVFAFNFVGKIWGGLEKPLVDYIVEWIKLRAQEISSGYERQYYQHLVYEHQVFDVKGLSTQTAYALKLQHVFVELSIDPKAPHQASADPLQVPEHLRQGEHSIWDYLSSSSSLANPHLVILGAPGSGKTTLLKHIALMLAQHKHLHPLTHTFPILLFLRDHATMLKEQPDFSLADSVHNHMQKKWQLNVPAQWINRHLAQGKCLVLLDGLDEVADAATRRQMADWVQRQMLAYGNNRFVLTSRPYGYRNNPLDDVTVLEVHPFTPQQVERFVQNWYLANELKSWGKDDPGVHLRAREGAEDLLERLYRAPVLLALAVNPLLLTMIATVHRYRSSLPGKRVALYAEICEVFLGKRQEARGIAQELSPAQKQQVLQPLAYHLMQQNVREITYEQAQQVIKPDLALVNAQMTPDTFLQLIENTSGLLLERNPGSYSFAHLTFQEYLAAVHIKEQGLEQVLVAQVGNSWWHETIRLYCAQTDATNIILACLAGGRPSVSALTLALECDEEKLKIQPSAQTQLDSLLKTGIEDPDPERRRIVAEVLLARRLREMKHFKDEVYRDTSLISCVEYQIFLDEQRAQGKYHQPDHWKEIHFPLNHAHNSVLGVRPSDATAFCSWLTKRELGIWHYRLPKTEEVEAEVKSISDLPVADIGYWINAGKDFSRPGKSLLSLSDSIQEQNDLVRQFELHLSLADAPDQTFVHALSSVLNPDHSLAPTITRDLGFVSINPPLPQNLVISTFANDLTRDLVHTIANDLANESVSQVVHALNLNSDLTGILDLARAFSHDLDLNRARDLANLLIHPLASTLASALDRSHTHAYDLQLAISHANFYLRTLILINALNFINTPYTASPSPSQAQTRLSLPRRGGREQGDTQGMNRLLTDLSIYQLLAILEGRRQGTLEACEGILIMKERKQANQ